MASSNNHFEHFNKRRSTNPAAHAKSLETVSILLSNFGNDVYECTENFAQQDIEFKDLASLTRGDLELLGIKDVSKQIEMLNTFKELSKQVYSFQEVKESNEGQKYNSQIIDKTSSYLDTMRMSLLTANIKLKVKPSNDSIVDDKYFASKFVIDALNELQKVTDNIEKEITRLDELCKFDDKSQSSNFFNVAAIATVVGLCTTFLVWKMRK